MVTAADALEAKDDTALAAACGGINFHTLVCICNFKSSFSSRDE
jgi:hypothetical protein